MDVIIPQKSYRQNTVWTLPERARPTPTLYLLHGMSDDKTHLAAQNPRSNATWPNLGTAVASCRTATYFPWYIRTCTGGGPVFLPSFSEGSCRAICRPIFLPEKCSKKARRNPFVARAQQWGLRRDEARSERFRAPSDTLRLFSGAVDMRMVDDLGESGRLLEFDIRPRENFNRQRKRISSGARSGSKTSGKPAPEDIYVVRNRGFPLQAEHFDGAIR